MEENKGFMPPPPPQGFRNVPPPPPPQRPTMPGAAPRPVQPQPQTTQPQQSGAQVGAQQPQQPRQPQSQPQAQAQAQAQAQTSQQNAQYSRPVAQSQPTPAANNNALDNIVAEPSKVSSTNEIKRPKEKKLSKVVTALYWLGFVLCLAGIAVLVYMLIK